MIYRWKRPFKLKDGTVMGAPDLDNCLFVDNENESNEIIEAVKAQIEKENQVEAVKAKATKK